MSSNLRTRITVGIVIATLCVLGLTAANASGDRQGDGSLVGMFADASPLDKGSEVRAAGVKVGVVDSIKLRDGVAAVTLSIDKSILPVHADASLNIRPINLLGEHYVALDEGTDSAPLLTSGVVEVKQTSNSVTLQDLLDTFDDTSSTGLAGLVTTLGEGMSGSGSETAAAIERLSPAMASAQQLGTILDEQNALLTQIIDRVHPIAKSLADGRGKTLDALVSQTSQTLGTLAAEQGALGETVDQLPPTLDEVQVTLRQLSRVSGSAEPLLKSIRPVTDNLSAVSSELLAFAEAADPALHSLEPVLRKANQLLKNAAPVLKQARMAGPDLRGVAKGARSYGDELLDRNLYGLMQFVRKWALSTNNRDGLSHYFRGVFHVTPASLNSLLGADLIPKLPAGPEGKSQTTDKPGLKSLEDVVDDLLNGVLPTVPLPDLLGLTAGQEDTLLSQLLGGL